MTTTLLTTGKVDALRVALMAAERASRFGARMRERREELGLSQTAVADRIPVLSVTKDYISRWELGKVEASGAYLEHIADALETSVGDLMAGPIAEREEKGPTPDLFGTSQLDRIEAALGEILSRMDALELQLALLVPAQASADKPPAKARKSRKTATKRAAG